jgi:predicted metal-dependent hydrolase
MATAKKTETDPLQVIRLVDAEGNRHQIHYKVRRYRRARRIRLTLDFTGVILLTLPWRCPLEDGLAFIRQQKDWVFMQRAQIKQTQTVFAFLRRRPWIGHGGQKLPVYFFIGAEKARCVDRSLSRDPYLQFHLPDNESTDATLLKLLREWARYSLTVRTAALAFKAGLTYRSVCVRNQTSRWGSCSTGRNISLNWRLVLLEPELQDYVILHELAHLKEMNHSDKFWRVLQELCPEAEKRDRQLTKLSADYRLLGLGRIEAA